VALHILGFVAVICVAIEPAFAIRLLRIYILLSAVGVIGPFWPL
jgi:hypothetical protein